jgi:hypothetical protein
MSRRALLCSCLVAVAALPAAAVGRPLPGPPATPPPIVHQLVVFRDGSFKEKNARARRVNVRVHGRKCLVPQGTPLAALAASKVAPIGLRDFGSCSRRARDAGGLFVKSLGPDVNAGQDGWVYKVGRKLGTAGAADPSGPFGHGVLRTGSHVVWFYCHFQAGSCQRTLSFSEIATAPPGGLVVHLRAYDDAGRSVPAAGATVHVDAVSALTGTDGGATIAAGAGVHQMWAEQAGLIRSFTTRVVVQ